MAKKRWRELVEQASAALSAYIKERSPVANNYLLFSEEIETESDEAAKWLEEQLKLAESSEDGGICSYERNGAKLWTYSEEYADVDRLVNLIAEYQKKFGDQKAVILTWACTCSKPRLSEFGGGAAVVVAGKVSIMSTGTWATALAMELVPGFGKEDKT